MLEQNTPQPPSGATSPGVSPETSPRLFTLHQLLTAASNMAVRMVQEGVNPDNLKHVQFGSVVDDLIRELEAQPPVIVKITPPENTPRFTLDELLTLEILAEEDIDFWRDTQFVSECQALLAKIVVMRKEAQRRRFSRRGGLPNA